MTTLQNNFTTHDQSKRLVELGVPADSADCYYDTSKNLFVLPEDATFKEYCHGRDIPCWSVGRLIEIYCIARNVTKRVITMHCLLDIVSTYEAEIEQMDFSILEE